MSIFCGLLVCDPSRSTPYSEIDQEVKHRPSDGHADASQETVDRQMASIDAQRAERLEGQGKSDRDDHAATLERSKVGGRWEAWELG